MADRSCHDGQMKWPSKHPADYRSPEPPAREISQGPCAPPSAAKGVLSPHPTYWFGFDEEEHAAAAAHELEDIGYQVKLDRAGGLFTRRRWELKARGTPEDLEGAEPVHLFEHWSSSRGGEYSTHDVPRTSTQAVCIVVAVATFRLIEHLVGLHLDDFAATLAALALGIPAGYAVARRIEPDTEARLDVSRPAA